MSINQYERASKVWDVLVEAAGEKKSLSYGEIGKKIGIHHRVLRFPLEYIQSYCLENELPALSILAVSGSTNLPGTGFIACDRNKIQEEQNKVYKFNWKDYQNPFKFAENCNNFEDILNAIRKCDFKNKNLCQIQSRGILQRLLREAGLKIYNSKCAMCEISIEELLEACHIKPFADCTDEEKKDIHNIIILCKNHHRLFDSGLITIDEEYKVHKTDEMELKTEADRLLLYHIENCRIHLPKDVSDYPDKKYIKYLNEN